MADREDDVVPGASEDVVGDMGHTQSGAVGTGGDMAKLMEDWFRDAGCRTVHEKLNLIRRLGNQIRIDLKNEMVDIDAVTGDYELKPHIHKGYLEPEVWKGWIKSDTLDRLLTFVEQSGFHVPSFNTQQAFQHLSRAIYYRWKHPPQNIARFESDFVRLWPLAKVKVGFESANEKASRENYMTFISTLLMYNVPFHLSFQVLWAVFYAKPDLLQEITHAMFVPKPFSWLSNNWAQPSPISDVIHDFPFLPAHQPLSPTLRSMVFDAFETWFLQPINVLSSVLFIAGDRGAMPAQIGYIAFIDKRIELQIAKIETKIENFFNLSDTISPAPLEPCAELERDSSGATRDSFKLLFGPSGVGKTKRLESLLSKPGNWGMHFVSGSLGASTSINSKIFEGRLLDNFYGASGQGHSLDLRKLWELANSHSSRCYGAVLETDRFFALVRIMMDCRLYVLSLFQNSRFQKAHKMNPAGWFEFQASEDPFSELFFLSFLKDGRFPDTTKGYEKLHICLDEAQRGLTPLSTRHVTEDGPYMNRIPWRTEATNFLSLLLEAIKTPRDFPKSSVIISGTSLNLAEVKSAVRGVDLLKSIERFYVPPKDRRPGNTFDVRPDDMICDFSGVEDETTFATLLDQRLSLHHRAQSDHWRLQACKSAAKLRGRHLWSVYFIDQLIAAAKDKEITSPTPLNDFEIEAVANKARKYCIDQLKVRLYELHKISRVDLLRTICEVALDTHIFDRQTVFQDDEDCSAIGEAFAHVKKADDGQLRGCFKERLAVDAVMEWLVEERSQKEQAADAAETRQQHDEKRLYLRHASYQLLRNSTIHSSNIGFMAEWYLALQLWTCFRPPRPDEGPNSSFEEDRAGHTTDLEPHGSAHTDTGLTGSLTWTARRRGIVEDLETARKVTRGAPGITSTPSYEGAEMNVINIPEDVRVVKGTIIASSDKNIELSKWLEEARLHLDEGSEEPRSSFYLPSKYAGPDVVFVLWSELQRRKIVCSVQSKTGKTQLAKEDAKDAIRKSSVYWSYPSFTTEKGEALREKLNGPEWENADFLSILVCTGEQRPDILSPLLVPYEPPRTRLANHSSPVKRPNEYFLFCDHTKTKGWFGSLFERVIRAWPEAAQSDPSAAISTSTSKESWATDVALQQKQAEATAEDTPTHGGASSPVDEQRMASNNEHDGKRKKRRV